MKKFFVFLAILFVCSVLVCSVWASPRVFVLASYSPEDICEDPEFKGVKSALEENLREYQLKVFWLDSRRNREKGFSTLVREALEEIKMFDPDVIVALDDVAFQVALENFEGIGRPYIVFAGVNEPLDKYNERYHFLKGRLPVKNVTGVYEKLFLREALDFYRSWWLKGNYKIAVLYSTDPVAKVVLDQTMQELKGTSYINRLVYFKVSTLKELEDAVRKIKADKSLRLYFEFALSVKDGATGKYLVVNDIVSYLTHKLCIPAIYPNIYAIRLGLLGGVVNDFYRMGKQAGLMAVKLIKGHPIREVQVEEAHYFLVAINLKRLKECQLPMPEYLLNLADVVFVR